jgi:hypothetical protein
LNEERQATRVLALCANGESDRASQTAAVLRAQSPSSIYLARLQRSCAAELPGAAHGRRE